MGAAEPTLQAYPPSRADAVRRQESGLILLNLSVLAGLALLHVLFASRLGRPPRLFFGVVLGRLLMQTIELIWLQTVRGGWSDRLLPAYSHLSIWANVGFAFLLSRLGGFEDSHYVALMVVPVIAAGFRYRLRGILLVLGAVIGLTFLEIRLYFAEHPGVDVTEYFEATNVVLIYVVVAVVVAFLARRLHSEGAALAVNLAELERTRDRLVQEERIAAVGRLAGAIAHEIRNPVSLIVSALGLAGESGGLPAEEVREIVLGEARRLERLTTDFLLYARQRPPERSATSLAETLEYVASLSRPRAAEVGVEIEVAAAGGLEIGVDPFQVHQALLNLVGNALDATPAGGTVRLGAAADPRDGASFWVEDPGDAVPARQVGSIFEPFFTTKPQGTGLGLAIARSIARRHGGELSLVVNEPGRVRFEIQLPGPVRRVATENVTLGPNPDR